MDTGTKIRILKACTVFQAHTYRDLTDLARSATLIDLPDGAIIFAEGDLAESVWVLCDGRVEIIKNAGSGRSIILSIAAEGDLIGLSTLFFARHLATAKVINAATLLRLSQAALILFMDSHPTVTRQMFSFLARNMAQDHQRMADMAGAEVEVRLARTLCMLTDKFGTTVSVKRRELAGLAATSVETTIRFLSKMKKEGIVGSGGMGEILILDLERLRERGSAKFPMSLRDDAHRSYMPVAK